jgi:CelD/BcsL family acetyltransferase involved in cellulose biosynthesis
MSDYQIRLLRADADLPALQPEWQRLYAAASRSPFLSFEWTMACRRHICPTARLCVLTAWSGHRLAGVAPLREERTLGFRVLRFIADGRSDYLGFLTDPDYPEVEGALLAALGERSGAWDVALLRHLCTEFTGLVRAVSPRGVCSAGIEATMAPHLAFPGTWEALYAGGPSQLRHSKRPARKFEREGGIVERITGPEAADRVHDVAEVELHSWKGARGCARFQPGPGQELLRDTLRELGRRREVELWLARIEGHPIAFLVNFVTPERVCYYQGAYREDSRHWYPGGVLHYHAIRRAWDASLREYDFMYGGEGYKSGWTNGVRSIGHRAFYPDTVRGRLAFGMLAAAPWRLRQHAGARAARRFWSQLRDDPKRWLRRRAAEERQPRS